MTGVLLEDSDEITAMAGVLLEDGDEDSAMAGLELELVVLELELEEPKFVFMYTPRRPDPPQYSDEFPVQM